LPHRLKFTDLASFSAPSSRAPSSRATEGAAGGAFEVSGVCLDESAAGASPGSHGALVFRARIGDDSGIWRERSGDESDPALALVFADDAAGVWLDPIARDGLVIAKLARAEGAPAAPSAIGFVRDGGDPTLVDGQSVGVSGDGQVALVVDVSRKRLVRVDLADLSSTEVGEIDGGIDPQLAPVVSLDDSGSEALFMDAREERGDASLEGVELHSGVRTRLLGPLPVPSRVCGGFVPDNGGVFALTVRLGETPRARALLLSATGEHELLVADVEQPASTPAFLDAKTAVLPFSAKAWPNATYGPVDVTAIALDGRAPVALTSSGDIRGRVRVSGADLLVEGGATLLRLTAQPR
jgi:hypothetical protein